MPLRAPKMNGRIFGFQRFVWWPKCTPASRSARIEIGGSLVACCIVSMFTFSSAGSRAFGLLRLCRLESASIYHAQYVWSSDPVEVSGDDRVVKIHHIHFMKSRT